jgi:hypothetical protein
VQQKDRLLYHEEDLAEVGDNALGDGLRHFAFMGRDPQIDAAFD